MPGALLPLVIALEVLGAIAIIVGYRTRLVAAALLAGFSIVSGVLFHGGGDQMQQVMLLKNVAIAGGFLFLVARGAGDWSLDARRTASRHPVTTRAARSRSRHRKCPLSTDRSQHDSHASSRPSSNRSRPPTVLASSCVAASAAGRTSGSIRS